MSVELAQKIAYGVIDPVTRRPYLAEGSNSEASQSLSWASDKPGVTGISSAPSFPKPVLLAGDAGRLEDEFSNKIPAVPSFTQFNRNSDKSRYFKVAKPKLVTQKSSDAQMISSQQRNIKDFFKGVRNDKAAGSASVSHKIRTFFLPKKPEEERAKEEQEEEQKLAPLATYEDSESEPEKYDQMEEEEENEEEEVSKKMQVEETKAPIAFQKFSSFSNGFDLFKDDGMSYTYKSSKSLSKAFRVPTLKKDQVQVQEKDQDKEDTQAETQTQSTIINEPPPPVLQEVKENHLKRKAEGDIRTSFDSFAFKVILFRNRNLNNNK